MADLRPPDELTDAELAERLRSYAETLRGSLRLRMRREDGLDDISIVSPFARAVVVLLEVTAKRITPPPE